MESFELIVKDQSYKIIRDGNNFEWFNVFNHSTRYIIKRNEMGIWVLVKHCFGDDGLPIIEVGNAIDSYYNLYACKSLIKHD